MTDLLLISPELVLVGVALVLIVVARHVHHARSAAVSVGVGAIVAVYCAWAFFPEARATAFAGTIAGDASTTAIRFRCTVGR